MASRKTTAEFKRRSAAAKKAAATRRANVERARRSAAAKKAAATRKRNEAARAREAKKRSAAAKKGWAKRRAAQPQPPSRQSRRVAAGRRTTDVDSLLTLAESSPGFRQRFLDRLRFEAGTILADDPSGRTYRFYVVTNEDTGEARGYWTSARTFDEADEDEPEEVVFGDYEPLRKRNVVLDAAWEFTEPLHLNVGTERRPRALCDDPEARELTKRKRAVTCGACARLMRDGKRRKR